MGIQFIYCIILLRPETDERLVDLAAQYNTTTPGGYVAMMYTEEKRAIRPVMIEDRILAVEQKFFCDRTTEKTVTLTVTDSQNTPMVSFHKKEVMMKSQTSEPIFIL